MVCGRMGEAMNRAVHTILVSLLSTCCVAAMDRWAALSMLESADNDRAVGPAGEVSRYQIRPELWNAIVPSCSDPSDPCAALVAAQGIMQERCTAFERRYHRPPADFEFYVLWNAPAQLIGPGERAAIPKAVVERAQRFCNLVARQSDGRSTP